MATLLPIAQRGEPILQQRALEVADLHAPAVQTLIGQMLATLLASNGVGIAAPQVYAPLRIIIVASRPNPRYPAAPLMEPCVMVNPEIRWQSPATCKGWEGCLSVPGLRSPVPRAERLHLRYLTRDGTRVDAEFTGFVARIIQHECDHLDGILFLSRVEDESEIVTEQAFQALIAAH